MTAKQDAKLKRVGQLYDISVSFDGDVETEDSFDSAIISSIFTDDRAQPSQMPIPERRRGWIGNSDSDYKLGSLLWLYQNTRLLPAEINQIPSVVVNCLNHFVEDGLIKKVSASVNIENQKLILSVRLERHNNKVDYRFFDLWENTGE